MIHPPSSSRSLIPRTLDVCLTPTSALRMSSPTMKQPSTTEPVPLHKHQQNQKNPRLGGTRHPRRRAGNGWAISSRNPAGTLKHIHPRLQYYIPLYYMSQAHIQTRVDNTRTFLAMWEWEQKKQKTKIANDFILRIHDSTIGVESVFRARGTVTWTENCGLQMRLRIGMIRNDVRDDVTLLFGCYQAFGLGLLLICFAGTGLVDKGTGFCPALTIWSCLGFGFGSGLVLWHMYRN